MKAPSSVTFPNGESLYVVGHDTTITAVRSGSWNNHKVWDSGRIPGLGDNVYIPRHLTIKLHGPMHCNNIVCGGSVLILNGARLYTSTFTGLPDAYFIAGSKEDRIKFSFNFHTRPFEDQDKGQIGNGFVWAGGNYSISIHGYEHEGGQEYGLVACSNGKRGDTLYLDRPAHNGEFKYTVPLSNSCVFRSPAKGKSHAILFQSSGTIEGLTLDGFGRTDKSTHLDPVTNPVGRYGLHVHRAGTATTTRLKNVTSIGSVGWGIVNHSSRVEMNECVVADAYGAGIVGEAGNEEGWAKNCTVIGMRSREVPNPGSRQTVNDRWHSGEAFAASGPRFRPESFTAIDVSTGVACGGRAINESIGGHPPRKEPFEDGVSVGKALPKTLNRISVFGYSRFGIWNWAMGSGVAVEKNANLFNGEEGSIGVLNEYTASVNLSDSWINDGDVGIHHRNESASHSYHDMRIVGVFKGITNHKNSLGRVAVHDCFIFASEVGIECTPVAHGITQVRQVDITDSEIDAPVEVLAVDPGPPYEKYKNRNHIYWDGVLVPFPWQ